MPTATDVAARIGRDSVESAISVLLTKVQEALRGATRTSWPLKVQIADEESGNNVVTQLRAAGYTVSIEGYGQRGGLWLQIDLPQATPRLNSTGTVGWNGSDSGGYRTR